MRTFVLPVVLSLACSLAGHAEVEKVTAGRPPVIYPPVNPVNPADTLVVRDRFWDSGSVIARAREHWTFALGSAAPSTGEGR